MYNKKSSAITSSIFIVFITILSIFAYPNLFFLNDNILTAQARSKSSGNEAMREIQSGLDLTGKSKTEVLKLIGGPWEKDKTPNKGRYTEKWTYSCEDKSGLTSNCVFIYFSGDRVKNVEIY